MHKMTESNLSAAFAGESQAHLRYLLFAARAESEYPNVARLFRAIAYAEQVHASNHLEVLGGVKSVIENLQTAIDGETFEIDEMYPAYFEVAKLQSEKGAMLSTTYAHRAEQIHAALYGQAKEAVSGGSDVQFEEIYICPVCGHTAVGEAPGKCPVCGQPRENYKKF